MQRVKTYLIVLVFGLWLVPLAPAAAAQKTVLISEVQTGSGVSASDEFVELYNTTGDPVDVSGWSLYYKSATGTSWSKKATVADASTLPGHDFWIFSTVIDGDTHYSSGLSESGGNIQIRDKDGNTVDQLAWGTGDSALGQPATYAHGGQSMYRLYDHSGQLMVNTDNNFNDFDVSATPTPGVVPAVEVPEADPAPVTYPQLLLTELFPDPASPQSDTTDEFIELYNPESKSVVLDGWKLVDASGKESIVKGKTIAPLGYLALMITETGITLNNTGDTIRLIDPNGDVVDESADYGAAEEGLSWGLINGEWNWTTAPTPGGTNTGIHVDPDDFSPAATVAAVKKATAKKSTAKAAAPKTSKVAAAKATGSASNGSKVEESGQAQAGTSNWWSLLLIALGVGTIGYGIYEYRSDLQLLLKKLGAKLGLGRKAS